MKKKAGRPFGSKNQKKRNGLLTPGELRKSFQKEDEKLKPTHIKYDEKVLAAAEDPELAHALTEHWESEYCSLKNALEIPMRWEAKKQVLRLLLENMF